MPYIVRLIIFTMQFSFNTNKFQTPFINHIILAKTIINECTTNINVNKIKKLTIVHNGHIQTLLKLRNSWFVEKLCKGDSSCKCSQIKLCINIILKLNLFKYSLPKNKTRANSYNLYNAKYYTKWNEFTGQTWNELLLSGVISLQND